MKTTHRILVVEDEGIIAADIGSMVRRLGHEVVDAAATGAEAIAKAEQLRPDLVLMDIKLAGDMDGVTAAEDIRRRFHLPVVFLTAHTDPATLDRAKLTEPFGYIVKPMNERDLRVGIEMALHKHAMELRLAESEQWFATTLASIGDAVIATDAAGCIRFLNPVARAITGWTEAEARGHPLVDVLALTPDAAPPRREPFSDVLAEGVVIEWTSRTWLQPRNGNRTPIDYTAAPIRGLDGLVAGIVVVFRDISPRLHAEEERERLISELKEALDKVRTLTGFIPICSQCKKVREDRDYWVQVEAYVAAHSDAKFTHTLCPICMRFLYPDFAEEILDEEARNRAKDGPEPWRPRKA